MTIHNTTQITGESEIRIYRGAEYVFVQIGTGNSQITMHPKHVRQLAAALDAFEAQTAQVSA